MTSIDHLAAEVCAQADILFPNRTDEHMLLKLFEEVGEFVKDRSAEEMADVFIMLLDISRRKGWLLENAIRDKMEINQNRKWRDINGVFQHEE